MTATATARSPSLLASTPGATLFVLWTTYASFYFCRVNIGPSVSPIQKELGFTAIEVGFLLGAVKVGYALGQLVNGQLTERYGARRILTVGMLGSAAATLLLAAAPTLSRAGAGAALASGVRALVGGLGLPIAATGPFALMLLLAFFNGWFQSAGWSPCVKVAGRWFPVASRGLTMSILGTSLSIGSAIALFAVGGLLSLTGSWRAAFVATAFVLLASFVHMALRLREHPPVALSVPLGEALGVAHGEALGIADGEALGEARVVVVRTERIPIGESLGATLGNPRIWILAFSLFGLDAVRYGFLDWAPKHLAEVHGTGPAVAALKTAVFPLGGALGALCSGPLSDRFFQSRRAPVCAAFLAAMGILTFVYRSAVGWGALPTVICLGLVGFFLFGAQILLVGTAAQDFARGGATAAAAGFVDFMGHIGAFTGDIVTPWTQKHYGWDGAITWWGCSGLAAAVLVSTLWRAKPHETTAD